MDYSTYDISQYARGVESYADATDILTSSAAAGFGAAFGAMMGIYFIVAIVIAVLQVIAMWKIFSKAGEAGWKSLIPIYNSVILFKISGLLSIMHSCSWMDCCFSNQYITSKRFI